MKKIKQLKRQIKGFKKERRKCRSESMRAIYDQKIGAKQYELEQWTKVRNQTPKMQRVRLWFRKFRDVVS